ncbi:helix-turn-helix domain-containing protein [Anaerovorax odorimutans]|uniref:helix-turn-helix domain-containing protein n=1 Tax=Anaerovorax odorimutans TaxID=109327 RepID=UPI00040E404C|nr:helix-turn-helix transcriptional regulator [Anaerovorax odorimutans]
MKINTPNDKKNIIGERLKTYRKQNKITQEDLAARLQLESLTLDRTAISKIERNERLVTDYEVVAIAAALRVEVKWLLTGK